MKTVVLGGGFAGLYTALRLPGQVQLIDERDRFTFLPLLYEYACNEASLDEISAPYAALLPSNVEHVKGTVQSLDLDRKCAVVDDRTIRGDAMVVALGKEPIRHDLAMPFYRLEDAQNLRDQPLGSVLVVGGGYTGVELACHLSRHHTSVTLAQRSELLLPKAKDHSRQTAQKALRDVDVRLGCDVGELSSDERGIVALGETYDVVVWTAGTRQSAPVRALDNALKKKGASNEAPLRVDAALRVRNKPGVFALGDCAAVAGSDNIAPSAQTALQQANVAARNVQAYLDGSRSRRAFNYLELGELLSYGDNDGAATLLNAVNIDGPLAGLARRIIYAARMPTPTQRLSALAELASSSSGLPKKRDA